MVCVSGCWCECGKVLSNWCVLGFMCVDVWQEVRNLQWLGFRIPFSVTLLASQAKQVYPYAVSLRETIRMYVLVNVLWLPKHVSCCCVCVVVLVCSRLRWARYAQTCSKVTHEIAGLVAAYKREVQLNLNDGTLCLCPSVCLSV